MKALLEALGMTQREDGNWGSLSMNVTQGPGEVGPQIVLVAQPAVPEKIAKANQAVALQTLCRANGVKV